MPEPRILLSGRAFGQSLRWHQDRLWLANCGTQPSGPTSRLRARLSPTFPATIPFSLDWLPDGRCSSCWGKRRSSCAWSRTGRG